jgi:hypothetical protein
MDMAISKDGTRMVTITYEKNIGIYDLINLKPFYSWYVIIVLSLPYAIHVLIFWNYTGS